MPVEVNRSRAVLTLSSDPATRHHLSALLTEPGFAATGVRKPTHVR